MYKASIAVLDGYWQWLRYIKPTETGWEAEVFPKGVFKTDNIETLVFYIGQYIMKEITWLVADALDVCHNDVIKNISHMRRSGGRDVTDARMIIIYILYKKFSVSQQMVCSIIGYKNHTSFIHARSQVENVKELLDKRDLVYKRYPFLRDHKTICHE